MITNSIAKAGPFACDGVQTVFDYTFPVLSPSHVVVYLGETPAETGFTVSGGMSGGRVTFASPPAAGTQLTIVRNVPLTQEVDLQNHTAFLPEVIEESLDRLTMICQELARELARCLKISDYEGQKGKEFLAPLYSPDFFGIPTAPTAPVGTSNNQIATTEYADRAVNGHNAWGGAHHDLLKMYVPPGTVLAFPSTFIPFGFLYCDGSAVSRTTYWELFASIGTIYGAGDGSTTFNLPDFRGVFLRGYQEGTTNAVGTVQPESLPDIRGAYFASEQNNDFSVLGITPGGNNINAFHVYSTLPNSRCGDQNASGPAVGFRASYYDPIYGGSHVTPVNHAVLYMIKF